MPHRVAAIRKTAEQANQAMAVIGTDQAGTVVFWNEQAERLYGWRSAEAMGRDILELTPALLSKEEGSKIMDALINGRSWSGPFMVRNRHGDPMIVHVENSPVVEDGNVVGVVGVSRPREVPSITRP
jgi:PAS domain S-box-containing protein